MKQKIKFIILFSTQISIALIALFIVHILLLKSMQFPLFGDKIVPAYVVNAIMAIFIYTVLIFLRKNYESSIGFIYLFGSFFKFIIFFLLFYPIYKHDGQITNQERFAFLIPYFLCLIMETYHLVKLMNNNE